MNLLAHYIVVTESPADRKLRQADEKAAAKAETRAKIQAQMKKLQEGRR